MSYMLAYCGNFDPPYSTENDYARAFENNGHTVDRYQEGDRADLDRLIATLQGGGPDFVIWTRTFGLAQQVGDEKQWKMLAEARRHSIPVVGVHLDRWWGLPRLIPELLVTPYATVDLLLSADGGHDDQWKNADITHEWLPPGVAEQWCHPGTFREEYASEIAFVGSWQGGYHKEWQHRYQLVAWLQRTYGDRVKFWPRPGEHAVRGHDLTDLYWSTRVVVGDSCLVPRPDGSPMTHYCSDRIPETVGRGGYLLHPAVGGIVPNGIFYNDEWPLCDWWERGEWQELKTRIDDILERDFEWDSREDRINRINMIRETHTYERRVPQIIEIMKKRGLL